MRACKFLFGLLVFAVAGLAQAEPREVTVYAAASLTNALQDIGNQFNAKSSAKVKFSFAASSLLAKQIEAGADAEDREVLHERRAAYYVARVEAGSLPSGVVTEAPIRRPSNHPVPARWRHDASVHQSGSTLLRGAVPEGYCGVPQVGRG